MSRFKSWEGKAVDSNLPWHMPGRSLACAVAVSRCSVAQHKPRHTHHPSSFQPWQLGPTSPARRGTNMLPKTYLTFGIYPALSQAHPPPPHIEPASTHQHDGLNDL